MIDAIPGPLLGLDCSQLQLFLQFLSGTEYKHNPRKFMFHN